MEFIFFISAFLAQIVGTVAGFGSSTVFLPVALLFYDFKTALVLVAFLHIFGNVGKIGVFRQGINRDLILKFGLPSIILTFIGALLVQYIPQNTLKAILGAFLVSFALLSFWRENFQVKPTLLNTIFGGALSGLFAGLIGTGGAIRSAFLVAINLPKEKYIATSALIALAIDTTRIPVYISQGFLKSEFYWFLPILLIIALVGSYFGKLIVNKIPQKQFKKVVLAAIFLIGLSFVMELIK